MISTLLLSCVLLGQVAASTQPGSPNPNVVRTWDQLPCSTWWPEVLDVPLGDEISEDRAGRFLSVSLVDDATKTSGEPLLGTYHRKGNLLVFTPRFSFVAGKTYRIRRIDERGQTHEQDYIYDPAIPGLGGGPSFDVVKIYPTADVVPANLLKFYIHFNYPVREGPQIFDQIKLLDERGVPVSGPWMMTELWNEDATRLTLRIHPGRVKQGVNLRETEGPVLEPGKRYTLLISKGIRGADHPKHRSASGRLLYKDVTKTFRVVDEDHTLPRVDAWKVTVPVVRSTDRLTIKFPEPLDPHLAARCLAVVGPWRKAIKGEVVVDDDGQSWLFYPAEPWKSGQYSLVVEDILEDLAGNTPVKPFEVDADQPATERLPLTLRFRPIEPATP